MKPFRERNPAIIGFIGLAVIALILLGAFRADKLPIIGSGDTYQAQFSEIGSLKGGNEVRVAGVPVGKVQTVELDGNKVLVTFKIDKDTQLGRETSASIGIRTLLGAQYLSLQPSGTGDLAKDSTIPLSRTTSPYDVVQAFSDLSRTTDQLDQGELSKALDTLADVASQTPEEFRGAIRGVSDLSRNLAARDEQINTLLRNLKKVTAVLNSRDDQLVTLFRDASTLFDAISDRRDSIHALLVSTQEISTQLRGLVGDVRDELRPTLRQLEAVTALLRRNEQSLDQALNVSPGFLRVFANALGTGPWFDTYIQVGGDNSLMATWLNRLSGASKLITVVVVLALVVGLVLIIGQQDDKRYLTAQFQQSNSLYEGSDVKILGVPVGTVDTITPQGRTVRVKIAYDDSVKLPQDVKAVIVSPAVVGDRYVQLTPAYDGGQALANNAAIGVDRTAVPVELDQVYSSLDDLSVALGPDGANKNGSLSSLVSDTADQLDGQGAQVNETIRNFGKLSQTLSDNKDDLFGSVREVNDFVQLLNRNDGDVRDFFDSTARVSEVLEGEREDLKATLEQLSKALIDVRTLVRENRGSLRTNVRNLTTVADVLGRNQKNIDGFTVNAPTALSNVALTYNGQFGSLDNRADILDLLLGAGANIGTIACDTIGQYLPDNGVGNPLIEACKAAGGTLGGVLGPILGDLGGVLTPRAAAASDPQTTGDPQRSLDDMLAVK